MDWKSYLIQNKPSIMVGVGIGGVIIDSILWFNAGLKCAPIVESVRADDSLTRKEQTALICRKCAKHVVAPAIVGAMECAAFLKAHNDMVERLGLATAIASMHETANADLRNRIHKELGETAATRIENRTLEDEIKREGPPQNVQVTGHGDVLVRNMIGGRDFYACYSHLLKSIQIASEMCRNDGCITVNTFFNIIGIDGIDIGDVAGWFDYDLEDGQIPVKITSIVDEKYDAILAISTYKIHSLEY